MLISEPQFALTELFMSFYCVLQCAMITTPFGPAGILPSMAICIELTTYAVMFSVSNISKKPRYFTLLLWCACSQIMRINTYYILFYCNFDLKGLDIFEVLRDRAIKQFKFRIRKRGNQLLIYIRIVFRVKFAWQFGVVAIVGKFGRLEDMSQQTPEWFARKPFSACRLHTYLVYWNRFEWPKVDFLRDETGRLLWQLTGQEKV